MNTSDMVFVFGSNLAGIHGSGAARFALYKRGAEYGEGIGFKGNSYAIPTKDEQIKTLPLAEIELYVEDFLDFARENPHKTFYVTKIGCGLAGYDNDDIAPLFFEAPDNCYFDEDWEEILGEDFNYVEAYLE